MLCTIYVLKNTVNDKVYVGQTWQTLQERMAKYTKRCPYLFAALNKYGKDKFYYEILTVCGTQETADYWEKYFIKKYNSNNRRFGYNISEGGWSGKISPESLEKLKASLKGKHCNPSTEFKPGHTGIITPVKLSFAVAEQIRAEHKGGTKGKDLAKKYNVSAQMISYIINNKQWTEK